MPKHKPRTKIDWKALAGKGWKRTVQVVYGHEKIVVTFLTERKWKEK